MLTPPPTHPAPHNLEASPLSSSKQPEPTQLKRRREHEHNHDDDDDDDHDGEKHPVPSPSSQAGAAVTAKREETAVNPREAALRASNAELERQVRELESQRDAVVSGLREKDARKTVQKHIKLLHDYNEVRDVALGLMGLVADNRGCEVKEVMEEFGLDPKEK